MSDYSSVSIRDVAAALTPPPNLERKALPLRRQLGQEAHSRFRAEHDERLAEVDVQTEYRSASGVCLCLHGRIDQVELSEDRVKLIEFKTVFLSARDIIQLDNDPPERFTLQLKLYAYIVALADPFKKRYPLDAIDCRLVIHNLADDEQQTWEIDWSVSDVEAALERYIDHLNHHAAELNAAIARRKGLSDEIKWLFPGYRNGQLDLISVVDTVMNEGRDLICEAPPGFGKTAVMLFSALKNTLCNGNQLFFTTAKGGGRNTAHSAIRIIQKSCSGLRTLFLSARDELCPLDYHGCEFEQCHYKRRRENGEEIAIPQELLECNIITIKELQETGEKHSLCTVELASKLTELVDLVVGDYNFVFDPAARLQQFRDPSPEGCWTLLIDEAHNLFERGCDMFSAGVDLESVNKCINILELDLLRYANFPAYKDMLVVVVETRERISEVLDAVPPETVIPLEINESIWEELAMKMGFSLARLIISVPHDLDADLNALLWDIYGRIRYLAYLTENDRESYPFYGDALNQSIGIRCLDPGDSLGEVHNYFSNIIAFSATMTPVDFYRDSLGFGTRPVSVFDVGHVFQSDQVRTVLAPGLDTRLPQRPDYARRIAQTINRFCNTQFGSYLIVFSSYEFMDIVAQYIEGEGLTVIKQERRMTADQRRGFRRQLDRPNKTTLALVVAGGQFTEAEDYPDRACIGVVVVGPCLPPPDTWREVMKDYWDRRGEDGQGVAYIYPAIRRVRQAAGRLIRNEQDRGVVLLIDDRFIEPQFFRLLPVSWRDDLKQNVDDWETSVIDFWRSREITTDDKE